MTVLNGRLNHIHEIDSRKLELQMLHLFFWAHFVHSFMKMNWRNRIIDEFMVQMINFVFDANV